MNQPLAILAPLQQETGRTAGFSGIGLQQCNLALFFTHSRQNQTLRVG